MNAGGVPNTCKSSDERMDKASAEEIRSERRMGEERVGNLPFTGGYQLETAVNTAYAHSAAWHREENSGGERWTRVGLVSWRGNGPPRR